MNTTEPVQARIDAQRQDMTPEAYAEALAAALASRPWYPPQPRPR